jgi:hypothetical protein
MFAQRLEAKGQNSMNNHNQQVAEKVVNIKKEQ